MKNKKIYFIILFLIIILISIYFLFFFQKQSKSSSQNITNEYIPQSEISDDELRKTIICLYFKNIETNSLIAEAKCIDVKDLYENPYLYLVNLLIAGSENEKLESPIPEGTKIYGCYIEGNTVIVDLSKEFIENAPSGIDEESTIVYSIVNTLTELNEVSNVKFLIDGEENKEFKDGKINFKNVFYRND